MSDVTALAAVFNRHAPGYDTLRRSLILCFDRFYGTVLTLVTGWAGDKPLRVLDLGAGTGLLAFMISNRFPTAELHLLDASAAMLDQARERFAEVQRASFIRADMARDDLGGPYDLVVSALAIHHLTHEEKRNLFARIRAALVPGGLFVNAEQVLGATAAVEARQNGLWLDEIRASGLPEREIRNAQERMKLDRCATLEEQLQWMRAAGFIDVDCSFRSGRFAVFSGQTEPAGA